MAFRFAVQGSRNKTLSIAMRKLFTPWETVFDDMFMLWFGIDFPSRAASVDAIGSER